MVRRIQEQTAPRGSSPSPLMGTPQVGPAIGEAFADIGRDLSVIANNELQKRRADEEVNAAKIISDNTIELEKFQLESIQSDEGGAKEFTKRMTSHYDEFTSKQLENLSSPTEKQAYEKWALQYRTSYVRNAMELQQKESRRFTLEQLDQTTENYAQLYQGQDIARLADNLPKHIEMLRETVYSSPLSAADKAIAFEKGKKKLAEIANDQAIDQASDIYLETVGKTYNHNKDGTLDLILDREGGFVGIDGASNNPALFGINRGSYPAEFDRIKQIYDTQGEKAAKAEARKFYDKEIWQKHNLSELPGDVAMVVADGLVNHWQGFQKKLLAEARAGATPNELIDMRKEEYERLLRANETKYGQSFDGWMNRLGHVRAAVRLDSATTGNPLFDMLDAEGQMAYRDKARIAEKRRVDRVTKQQNLIEGENYATLQVAVNNLEVTPAELDQYRQNGTITAGHWATLRKALDARERALEDEINGAAAIQDVLGNDRVLEPNNTAHKKAADTFFKASLGQWQQSEDENIEEKALALVKDLGIVPESYRGMVQSQLRSNDPEQMVNAAGTIDKMAQENPRMLDDFKQGDIKAANHILALSRAGYDPVTAVKVAGEELKMDETRRSTREAAYKEERKTTDAVKVIESELNSIFVDDPDVPSFMATEFDILARNEFIRTGNMDAANKSALQLIQKTWGRTNIGAGEDGNTSARWMKNAPELFFSAPVPSMSHSEQSEWMQEQLVENVNEGPQLSSQAIEPDRLRIAPSGRKDKNGLPTYYVFLDTEVGMLRMEGENAPLEWQPDWQTSSARKRMIRREKDSKKSFEENLPDEQRRIFRETTGQGEVY